MTSIDQTANERPVKATAKPNKSRSKANTAYVQVPIPEIGETMEVDVPRYGLTLLVHRATGETQEQIRSRYTVVAPVQPDRRTHAARMGTGAVKAKKFGTTVCTENRAPSEKAQSGARIDLPLDCVVCPGCRKVLTAEGVEFPEEQK